MGGKGLVNIYHVHPLVYLHVEIDVILVMKLMDQAVSIHYYIL